ncbi:MAG: aminopeptidase [Saprospiraceae bacterium]|nr:aminopeptidase [Saprospiraceae bacterium]
MNRLLNKYATLLIDYCLEIEKGEKLFVKTTSLAQPLLREVCRMAIRRGAHVDYDMSMEDMSRIFYSEAQDHQLEYVSPLYKMIIEEYDAFLVIRAPFNLREDQNIDPEKMKKKSRAHKGINETYFERTATRQLKRSLCQYPTSAAAQEAGMSLEEYSQFVYNACHLFDDDPQESWLKVRKDQQRIVDYLNNVEQVKYKGPHIDVSFSVKGRTWINSDGRNNMPSGEVFSAPVEDTVNGRVQFSYPCVYRGKDVKGVTLEIKDGLVVAWDAEQGKDTLDQIFDIDGARRFGEVAIGTNYNIQRSTKNILFDEKIGGTVHMAIGQSYKQCGGQNSSTIHWDMITDMKDGGEVIADDKTIYRNGEFLI